MDYLIDELPEKNLSKLLSFVVIGGMSFHGARIANYLHDMNFRVTVIEDAVNIEPDPLKWYRWTQLPMKNQDKIFIDFSLGTDELQTKLQAINPDVILYVPTAMADLNSVQGDPVKIYQLGSATVRHFQKLLSIIPELPSIQKVILLSTMDNKETNLIYKTWMSSLEQMIHFYGKGRQLVNTTSVLIKVNGVFGPWKETIKSSIRCWYIDSIAQLVLNMSNRSSDASSFLIHDLTNKCEHDVKSGNTATDLWMNNFELSLKKQKRNVIAGAVLIVKSKAFWPHLVSKNDDHKYLEGFILTAMNYKPDDIVIIHNRYSDNFISKYKNACPLCHFVKYSPVNKRIAHDQRYYMIYDYLMKNPDIGNLVITDVRDVVFRNDPFKVMAEIGDYLYVSYNRPFSKYVGRSWLAELFKKCYPDFKNTDEIFYLHGAFNNGVMGGSRHVMLSLLSRMMLYFDAASLSSLCDMAAANAVYHLNFYDRIYCGYPFIGPFLGGICVQQGAAIMHKSCELFKLSGSSSSY